MSERQMTWRIGGMHCPKCESAVVKAVSALPGIREARADWQKGTLTALWDSDVTSKDALAASVAEAGYALETQSGNRIFRTVAVLLAAALLFVILELTPLRAMLSAFPTARAGMGFATLFALGLTTSLHCVGMCGGINLVQSAGAAQAGRKVGLSNLQYNLGRVLSYTVIGGIVGTLGSVIRLSTAVQAGIQIVAAVLMGLMALKLLDAGGLSLAMSGKLRSRLMGKGKRSSLWIGLVNGLMPCGPLQAMQLYALSTGSWWMGALSMLMRYQDYEVRLRPGDAVFVYTDGVPEASNAEGKQYSLGRMELALNQIQEDDPESVLKGLRADVDAFVKGTDQFDDLTMLCVAYRGSHQ